MDLHDYEIVSVESDRFHKALSLVLLSPDGSEKWILEIAKVRKLFVDGMQMQNVIFELEVFTHANSSHRYLRACELLDIASDGDIDFDSVQLVMIEASVGAEIAVLCDKAPFSLKPA